MSLPSTWEDWALIVVGILAAHGVFLLGAHAGLWGTDTNGHIHIK